MEEARDPVRDVAEPFAMACARSATFHTQFCRKTLPTPLATSRKPCSAEIRSAVDWEIDWIDDRVAGGDKLREEWREKCQQQPATRVRGTNSRKHYGSPTRRRIRFLFWRRTRRRDGRRGCRRRRAPDSLAWTTDSQRAGDGAARRTRRLDDRLTRRSRRRHDRGDSRARRHAASAARTGSSAPRK